MRPDRHKSQGSCKERAVRSLRRPRLPRPRETVRLNNPTRKRELPQEHPLDLAAAVGEHLLTITESHQPPAFFRVQALSALYSLLGQLPPKVNSSLAERLLTVAKNPGLNDYDQLELSSQDPLSRGRLDPGARSLAPLALVAAATAAALAADAGIEAESLRGQPTQYVITQAVQLLHNQDREAEKNGAIVLAMMSRYEPGLARYADALIVHPSAEVRGVAASTAVLDESAQRILAADSSPQVRALLASRGSGLAADVLAVLQVDEHPEVKRALTISEDSARAGLAELARCLLVPRSGSVLVDPRIRLTTPSLMPNWMKIWCQPG